MVYLTCIEKQLNTSWWP